MVRRYSEKHLFRAEAQCDALGRNPFSTGLLSSDERFIEIVCGEHDERMWAVFFSPEQGGAERYIHESGDAGNCNFLSTRLSSPLSSKVSAIVRSEYQGVERHASITRTQYLISSS